MIWEIAILGTVLGTLLATWAALFVSQTLKRERVIQMARRYSSTLLRQKQEAVAEAVRWLSESNRAMR